MLDFIGQSAIGYGQRRRGIWSVCSDKFAQPGFCGVENGAAPPQSLHKPAIVDSLESDGVVRKPCINFKLFKGVGYVGRLFRHGATIHAIAFTSIHSKAFDHHLSAGAR
jgi:hypothetical protein